MRWLNSTLLGAVVTLLPLMPASAIVNQPRAISGGLTAALAAAAPELQKNVLQHAVSAMQCALANGMEAAQRLAVIDFSLPSSQPRLWIFDLPGQRLLHRELVAHGRGSGGLKANVFSNTEGSHQSSIGLFRARETYHGKHGYSLRLDGLEPGFNDNARARAIVIHAADYVSQNWIDRQGKIGRSHGCPAVRPQIARRVVDHLKDGQFLFSYYPDQRWLESSAYLNCAALADKRQQKLAAEGSTGRAENG